MARVVPEPASPASCVEPDPSPEAGVLPRRWRRIPSDAMAAAVISVAAIVLVALHVVAYTQVSPIDELSHIDSMVRASEFEFVEIGDQVGQTALQEEACRGLDREDVIPACTDGPLDPQFFQEHGINTVASKFPLYHLVTGLAARTIATVFGLGSIVTAARLLGGVWLALGGVLTWFVMKELRIPILARAAMLALLMTAPVTLHTSAIVNSDATLLAFGAGVAYLVLRWERGAVPWWLVVGVGVVALFFEATNALAVSAMGLYLAVRGVLPSAPGQPDDVPRRGAGPSWLGLHGLPGLRALTPSLALGVGLLLVAGGGLAGLPELHHSLIGYRTEIVPAPPPEAIAVQHVPVEISHGTVGSAQIVSELGALITPVERPYVPGFLSGPAVSTGVLVSHWLLITGLVAMAALAPRGSRLAVLAPALFVVMVAAGPAHAMWNARRDVFFAMPTRFGLTLMPVLFALSGAMLRKRWVSGVVLGFAAFVAVAALWKLV